MKFVNYADNIQIYFLKKKLFVYSRDLLEISEVILTTRIALLVVTKLLKMHNQKQYKRIFSYFHFPEFCTGKINIYF
jgi:hypothetical protein